MDEKRLLVALFGVAVAGVALYIAYQFVAAITVAFFLYYSTRRFYRGLGWLRIPSRTRAVLTLLLLAVPLLLLLSYTAALLIVELRQLVVEYPVVETIAANVEWIDDVQALPEPTPEYIWNAYQSGELDPFIDFVADHAPLVTNVVGGFLLNLLIVVVVTYYLLVDDSKAHEWLLQFDDDAIVREYLEAADSELEAVLFGNLLNVIATALIAVVAFMSYNMLVPATVQIPYPALAGVLTGVASLIPVVGMKIVYVPIAAVITGRAVLAGDLSLLGYVAGFVVVAIVVVDTIPDLVLRPYLSGERTHVGLLMMSYIFGPVVFGFYGLFLAPIILVLGTTFADTALPQLLGADGTEEEEGLPPGQQRLTEY